MFNVQNSVRPSREFIRDRWKQLTYRLGFEDYIIPYFLLLPAGIIFLYQAGSMYFFYGYKRKI